MKSNKCLPKKASEVRFWTGKATFMEHWVLLGKRRNFWREARLHTSICQTPPGELTYPLQAMSDGFLEPILGSKAKSVFKPDASGSILKSESDLAAHCCVSFAHTLSNVIDRAAQIMGFSVHWQFQKRIYIRIVSGQTQSDTVNWKVKAKKVELKKNQNGNLWLETSPGCCNKRKHLILSQIVFVLHFRNFDKGKARDSQTSWRRRLKSLTYKL